MDDSEKSYGYSEDLYHGKRAEKSYEYGPEGEPENAEEIAPEEEAIHIVGPRTEEPEPAPDTPEYDYSRESPYVEVESFTWKNPEGEGDLEKQGKPEAEDRAAPDAKP